MAQRTEVEDRQTAIPQSDFGYASEKIAKQNGSRIIRAAMCERLRTPFEDARRDLRIARDNAKDSAHQLITFRFSAYPNHTNARPLRAGAASLQFLPPNA